MLIGIVKKNAIMMIDFALVAQREQGKNTEEAIYHAAVLRFRPIMMTSIAAILGALPIALGLGAGAELRKPLGVCDRRPDCVAGADALYGASHLHLLRALLAMGDGQDQTPAAGGLRGGRGEFRWPGPFRPGRSSGWHRGCNVTPPLWGSVDRCLVFNAWSRTRLLGEIHPRALRPFQDVLGILANGCKLLSRRADLTLEATADHGFGMAEIIFAVTHFQPVAMRDQVPFFRSQFGLGGFLRALFQRQLMPQSLPYLPAPLR
jgi:hypothetical protein